MRSSSAGSASRGFSARTTRSACLPAVIEPFVSSSKYWYAAPRVTACRASRTVARWRGPSTCPLRVFRLTVMETSRMTSGGTIGASLCTVKRTPRSIAQRTGLTLFPRASPKLRRCQSPQKKAWAEKNEGTTRRAAARSS